MSLETRTWLNAEFVQKILKNSESDSTIDVKRITRKIATQNGDNYSSDIIRVGVEYSRNESGREIIEKKSLLVKVALTQNDTIRELLEEVGCFKKETQMMDNTLIKMNEILDEKDFRLGARVLYSEIGDPPILVIEDLAPLGYRMANRQAGLDLQHCILAMRGLAKFHASSVALCEKEPEQKMSYTKGVYHQDHPESIKKFFTDGLRAISAEVAAWSELETSAKTYSEKLLKLVDVCYERATQCAKPKDEFNVLNHGDFWANNMLFRYSKKGNVTDHIFVDFQVCFWSSPAIDVLNFLATSASHDVFMNHRAALIEEYFNLLTSTMIRIGCKTEPPSMAALQKTLKEHEFLEVMSSFLTLPFVLIDRSEVKTMGEIMDDVDGYVNPAYKGNIFRKMILSRLHGWNVKGLLDV